MRGATSNTPRPPIDHGISIHAPHAGRDEESVAMSRDKAIFQSTRPMRGATFYILPTMRARDISIHAPHAGRDAGDKYITGSNCISIHAPLAGCDVEHIQHTVWFSPYFNPRAPCGARPRRLIRPTPRPTFQSTRPVRGATSKKPITELRCQISIHAPRAGRDCSDVARCSCQRDFNPRAPCGARPQGEQGIQGPEDFNPRAPCGARPAPTPLSSRS